MMDYLFRHMLPVIIIVLGCIVLLLLLSMPFVFIVDLVRSFFGRKSSFTKDEIAFAEHRVRLMEMQQKAFEEICAESINTFMVLSTKCGATGHIYNTKAEEIARLRIKDA